VRVLEPVVAELAAERLRREERRTQGRRAGAGGDSIASPMQGTVLRVEVREGEPVEPGQVLVIVEAMKMENEIATDRPGVVSDLRVTAGDAVRSGQVLLSVIEGG
jgi:acetyl-CoA/propionyl-CoA carboxylase, biotin carboxylase, biotin carboxyl carrier protein